MLPICYPVKTFIKFGAAGTKKRGDARVNAGVGTELRRLQRTAIRWERQLITGQIWRIITSVCISAGCV